MKVSKVFNYLCLIILLSLSLSGCTLATIRPLDTVTGKPIIGNEDEQFNAATYVQDMWDTQVLPVFQNNTTDVNTVLSALRENKNAASEKYGHHDGQQPYSFVVSGTGVVKSVNTESRAGLALIDTTGDGTPDLSLAIGPVIRGTAIRDSMPFISFNQFTNQIQYASVSNEMNALVSTRVIAPLGDVKALEGKNITFAGSFTLAELDQIVVTPAVLTVGG
jgi:predicted lipoprotein